MKTTANRNTMNVPVTHVADVPPRWGLGFVEDLACYKHVAPLALGGSRPPEPDVPWAAWGYKHVAPRALGVKRQPRCNQKLQRSVMFIESSIRNEPSSIGAAFLQKA